MGVFGRRAPDPADTARYVPIPPKLRVLRADGARIDLTSRNTGPMLAAVRQDWQRLAFGYRDMIGELRYAHRLLSRAVAQVRFYPAATQPGTDELVDLTSELPDDFTIDRQLVADIAVNFASLPLDANPDGFTARLVENLVIAGEAWIHIDADEQFHVRSTSEVSASADGKVTLNTLPGGGQGSARQIDPQAEDLLRAWIPHPEWGQLADSPMRALLDVAEDVVLAGREQRAAARSRVAANGFLLIPDSMSLVQSRDEDDDYDDSVTSDTFLGDLTAAMLAPIRDDGDAQSIVPILIRGDSEDLDKVRHLTVSRADSEQLVARQAAAVLRLLKGLDVQPEQVEGISGLNHWCVDEQTEVLTLRGWVDQDDLWIGEHVLTLNHETGMSEWQPVLDIYRAAVTDEPMIRMEGRGHSSLTTPNHRWAVTRDRWNNNERFTSREIVHTEDLRVPHTIPTGAPHADLPTTAKYADDFVELVGWFWTEGNINGGSHRRGPVTIAQSHTRNPARVDRIRGVLTRAFGPSGPLQQGSTRPAWRETTQANRQSHGGPITVFRLNKAAATELHLAAPGKFVTTDFVRALTAAQLELFIQVSCLGDGWHLSVAGRSGQLDIWQRDPAALEAYELALILSGRAITRGTSSGGHYVAPLRHTGVRPVKAYEERRAGRACGGLNITRDSYTGVVWCPVTPNGTWFARRRGSSYFTGNSAWAVDTKSIKEQVEPMAATVAACLAAAFLRPSMEVLGHSAADLARITIGVDLSGLAENPNRGQDARDAHGAGVLSDAALLRELGFAEEDAPTDEEKLHRLAASGALPVGVTAALFGLSQQDVQQAAVIESQVAPDAPADDAPKALPAGPSKTPAGPSQSPSQPTPDQPDLSRGPSRPQTGPAPISAAAAVPLPFRAAAIPNDQLAGPDPYGLRVDVDACRALGDIDALLLDRIVTAADAAVARVVEKAGARVRSAAQRDRAVAASLAGVDTSMVAATLGRDGVEAFMSLHDLLAAGHDRLRRQVAGWLTAAAGQTAGVVQRILDVPPDSPRGRRIAQAIRSRLAARQAPALQRLDEILEQAAERALFEPDPLQRDNLDDLPGIDDQLDDLPDLDGIPDEDLTSLFPDEALPDDDLSDVAAQVAEEERRARAAEPKRVEPPAHERPQPRPTPPQAPVKPTPKPQPTPQPSMGERSTTLVRPAEAAEVLAIAGGDTPNPPPPARNQAAPLVPKLTGPAGFATGPVVTDLMGDEGAALLGHEWQYRPEIPRNTFSWHRELDRLRFATFTDPRLDTEPATEWIGPYYYPQDHDGCCCRSVPIYAVPELDDGIVARRLREAKGNWRNVRAAEVARGDDAAGRRGTSLQNEVEVRDRIHDAIQRMQAEHIGGET